MSLSVYTANDLNGHADNTTAIQAYAMYMFGWPQVLVMVGAMLSAQRQRRAQLVGMFMLLFAVICNAVYQSQLFDDNVVNYIVWQSVMMVTQFVAGVRFQSVMGSLRPVRLKTINCAVIALLLTGSIALSQLDIDDNLIHFTNGYGIPDWYVALWLALLALTAWLAFVWIRTGKAYTPQKVPEKTRKLTNILFIVAFVLFILLALSVNPGELGWRTRHWLS